LLDMQADDTCRSN